MGSPVTVKTKAEKPEDDAHRKAAAVTLASMDEVASTAQLTHFSNRSITEVEALKEEVSNVIPAGNIVGLVMGGLIRLRDRSLPVHQARSDVSALMRGIDVIPRNLVHRTVYGTLFVGPAAVLAAYQKLLTLTGKDPDSAFPDGLWQFYLEFALREDAARHANETIGFQQALAQYNLNLSIEDQLAAWVCAVSQIYFQYDDLLYNEWRERVYLYLIDQAVTEANLSHKISFKRLPQAWAAQRPYRRGADADPDENYALYRRRRFNNFLETRLDLLPVEQREAIEAQYAQREADELPAYLQQMSIMATLDPEQYRENKKAFPLWQARVGVVFNQRYYLLPACHTDQHGYPLLFETQQHDSPFYPLRLDHNGNIFDKRGRAVSIDRKGIVSYIDDNKLCGYLRPVPFQATRREIVSLFEHAANNADEAPGLMLDDQLIAIKRTGQERARKSLQSATNQEEIKSIKYAPVIINWDEQDYSKPLAYIRQGKRGIGDHALTLFRTPKSIVFDQSHIFFDGIWGMALAEILTGEAISWGVYFSGLDAPQPAHMTPVALNFTVEPTLEKSVGYTSVEVSAESTEIDLQALYGLCSLLPKRHPDLRLTVNDLLILYRCAYGHEYRPSLKLKTAISDLQTGDEADTTTSAINLVNEMLAKAQGQNPSIVIPMEATAAKPRERLYPTTFRNPFTELWHIYQTATASLDSYKAIQSQEDWMAFTEARRSLLAQLNYFGQLLRAYKKVALDGGSTSTATIKLLAYLPNSLLKLLDEIPQRVDVLNEVIKGEEVFSNVGRVARGSSLSRFISAKDDNDNKTLVWAVITDDQDILHLSLRDFRPHIAALQEVDQMDLAELITRDYLDVFVTGFNTFIKRLKTMLNVTATHTAPREDSR